MVRKIKDENKEAKAANVIDRMTIKIKGQEYICIKPAAVDIMRAEDIMMNTDGTVNMYLFQREMLKLVTKKVNIDDVVENVGQVVNGLDMSKIPYRTWLEISPLSRVKNGTGRIDAVETVLSILDTDKVFNIREMTKDEIDEIYEGILSAYDVDEVFDVIESIYTFCIPKPREQDSEASI